MKIGKIGLHTATALVISNMIGTGVFTSLGYQVLDLSNTYTLLGLWLLGGLMALTGAFIYSELAAYHKHSGGDYLYLSNTFHPIIGYLSSWVSLWVGFSAPVTLAALAMCSYLNIFGWNLGKGFATCTIAVVALFQSFNLSLSSGFQNISTLVKLLFIVGLIAVGLTAAPAHSLHHLDYSSAWKGEIALPAFAVALVYVSFAYTGWNSASYIYEEIKLPKKNLPKALIGGVGFVTIAYILLNYVFLKHASLEQLSGKEEVANIAFGNVLSEDYLKWISFFIGFQLLATMSGYLWIGSRLSQATAKNHYLWSFMKTTNRQNIPVRAVWVHAGISIALLFTGNFESVFTYTAFTLQLLATSAVSTALFIPKSKLTIIKGSIFYLLPVTFLLISFYICYFVWTEKPKESGIGLSIIVVGLVLYVTDRKFKKSGPSLTEQ
jgi:APA family basic amino acid/polyamine antiporter